MRPIAKKLARELRKAKRAKVVDLEAVRSAREAFAGAPSTEGLTESGQDLLGRFRVLAVLGQSLLGSHSLEKLALRVDSFHEAYMPGGPPMSPVTDSLFMTWLLCDATAGSHGETLASIVADLAPVLGFPASFRNYARACGHSRLGIYRVERLDEQRATLRDLVEDRAVDAYMADDWGEEGDLWLARIVEADASEGGAHVISTPYRLLSAERDWQQYLLRVVPSGDAAKLLAHFKHSSTSELWFDYVMDGYAGVEKNMVCLGGVPDRPESLPHSQQNEDRDGPTAKMVGSPLERVRHLLWQRAHETGLAEQADELIHSVLSRVSEEGSDSPYTDALRRAFQIYGYLDRQGRTVAEAYAESLEAESLDAEESRALQAILQGWFSIFEVRLVKMNVGLELFDTFRRKLVFVHEKSGTQNVSTGDVLAAQIMKHEDGSFFLEGALAHVPRLWATEYVTRLRAYRDKMRTKFPMLGWKARSRLTIPQAIFCLEAMSRNPPVPQLVNFDGDDLVWCEAHFDILDEERARRGLDTLAEANGDDEWFLADEEALRAKMIIEGPRLSVFCNSRERLAIVKEQLDASLGDAVRWKLDSLRDGESMLQEARMRLQESGAERPAPPELSPEAKEAVTEHLTQMMRGWMDEAIPLLGNKSPRQAVRSRRGKDQVTELLSAQERAFAANPQLEDVDLDFVWKELRLKRPEFG